MKTTPKKIPIVLDVWPILGPDEDPIVNAYVTVRGGTPAPSDGTKRFHAVITLDYPLTEDYEEIPERDIKVDDA